MECDEINDRINVVKQAGTTCIQRVVFSMAERSRYERDTIRTKPSDGGSGGKNPLRLLPQPAAAVVGNGTADRRGARPHPAFLCSPVRRESVCLNC